MSLSTSRTILKVAGVLSLIGAVFTLITGILVIVGGAGALASTDMASELANVPNAKIAVIAAAAGLLIAAAVAFIEGIISLKASRHNRYGTAALVFGILGFVSLISSVITTVKGGDFSATNIVSLVLSLVINILVVMAASKVRSAYKTGIEE